MIKKAVTNFCPAVYDTRHGVVNAADFGVPQNRKRAIAVSVRKDAADSIW